MAATHATSLVFTVSRKVGKLIEALQILQNYDVVLRHIESRPSCDTSCDNLDYFVQFEPTSNLEELVEKLRPSVVSVSLVSDSTPVGNQTAPTCADSSPWFPRTISEVRKCCTSLFKYGDVLTSDHPGFGDKQYEQRRQEIASVAPTVTITYSGNPIPKMTYTREEVKTWGKVFNSQVTLYPTHACKEHNTHYPFLFAECGYREDNIPQLEDVSNYLKSKTGWRLWPVIGWISARDFLNALAFRVFPTTQYIRHSSKPFYTPEPDICHELMGHAPLFCDPSFAEFSQEIGLASLGISNEWIDKLAALYWFTNEFGLVDEGGSPKAYGAGLLSGNEELQYCVTDRPEKRQFVIEESLVTKYPETGLQPLYFVASSFDSMKDQMSAFAKSIPRSFDVIYNHTLEMLDIKQRN